MTISLRRLQSASHAQIFTSNIFQSLNFVLAYYSYALGRPHECLSHIFKISDLPDVQSHIPLPASTRPNQSSLTPSDATNASSISWATTFATDASAPIAEIKDGRAWSMVEIIRSLCLQGVSILRLSSYFCCRYSDRLADQAWRTRNCLLLILNQRLHRTAKPSRSSPSQSQKYQCSHHLPSPKRLPLEWVRSTSIPSPVFGSSGDGSSGSSGEQSS